MKVYGIIVAAGTGSRMGAGMNKVYMPLGGKCVLWHTINAFCRSGAVDGLVIVTGNGDMERCREICSGFSLPVEITQGGDTRQQSVMNGLLCAGSGLAAVHDGARALITPEEIRAVIAAAREYGAAALGVTPKDTIKTADAEGFITGTVDRSSSYLIQTPQVFDCDRLLAAHKKAAADGFCVTDDCMVMEHAGEKIRIVVSGYENIKLTTPEDIYTAERILKQRGGL